MVMRFVKKIFGTSNDRYISGLRKYVTQINDREPHYAAMDDAQLKDQTNVLKSRLAAGETLDDILVDAFAVTREASKRVLGMRHFDVQLIGGMIIHRGLVTEMKTGEGKTLVATLPVYLNALTGKGVHLVTVNDYLVQRDASWMGQIYNFLGLSVGCIVSDISDFQRKEAYDADITYGTNNEFGFDYLRDNMKFHPSEMVQRPFNFAIVDEVDSILIDEARTPLIISGAAEDSSELYVAVDALMPHLTKEHFELDEKQRNVTLTDAGVEKIEAMLEEKGMLKGGNLYDIQNVSLVMHVNQALKAHTLFTKDKDYIVKDNKVMIIDEFTGRMLEGRRYSEGLHQAIEAKEHVEIQRENQTLASVTFQNYFRLYPKLSGMTGSAMTEAAELVDIYKLDVIDVPTNLPCIRQDHEDEVYRTAEEKYTAILTLIKECHGRQQPVLVGTTSIERSEFISTLLKAEKIPHHVLNARFHEQEAYIIAEAGRPGAITIATNMAGRGTDIKLGGNLEMRLETEISPGATDKEREKKTQEIKQQIESESAIVRAAGGLYVIGTERHESRRIDNQLRGRSGRQADPGASKFFLSLQDDLMRIFGSDRLDSMLVRLGLEQGEAITHPWVSKALEKAQQKVEARNYDIRKHLLKYDDVMNEQRKVVYGHRREIMNMQDPSALVQEMREDVVNGVVQAHIPENAYPEQWDMAGLHEECLRLFGLDLPVVAWGKEEGIAEGEITDRILDQTRDLFETKRAKYGNETFSAVERSVLLRMLDQVWKEHLLALDNVRQGINLRAYAQRDPLNEYKQEAFSLFQLMLERLKDMSIATLSRFEMSGRPEDVFQGDTFDMHEEHDAPPSVIPSVSGIDPNDPTTWGRLPRNAACPCGSGKKYKACHGQL